VHEEDDDFSLELEGGPSGAGPGQVGSSHARFCLSLLALPLLSNTHFSIPSILNCLDFLYEYEGMSYGIDDDALNTDNVFINCLAFAIKHSLYLPSFPVFTFLYLPYQGMSYGIDDDALNTDNVFTIGDEGDETPASDE
jgi:hypothetical protein